MPVENAMVDRVRTVRQVDSGGDEFAPAVVPEYSDWIDARVHTPTFMETRRDEAYEYRRELTGMINIEDQSGIPVDLKKTDKLELESIAFGSGEYEIVGDPEPIRSLEDVVYWQVALRKWGH